MGSTKKKRANYALRRRKNVQHHIDELQITLLQKYCTLSASNVSSVRWEITIKEKGEYISCLMMGYIDAEHIEGFQDWTHIGGNDNETALRVRDGNPPVIYSNHKETVINEEWHCTTNSGDRFRLDFDFRSKDCIVFYNDKMMGFLTKNLPQQIYLAASSSDPDASYEATLFDAV